MYVKWGRKFIGKLEWPPKFFDCNPRDALRVEVYKGRSQQFTKPIPIEKENQESQAACH